VPRFRAPRGMSAHFPRHLGRLYPSKLVRRPDAVLRCPASFRKCNITHFSTVVPEYHTDAEA
jgi:hypothetical protein